MYKKHLLLYIMLMIFSKSIAQQEISEKVNALVQSSVFDQGKFSVSIRNKEDGKFIYRFNAEEGVCPASNLKLLTTATAFKILGPEFRFQTNLYYSGDIKDSVLNGNLIIEGDYDPFLGSDRMGETNYFKNWIVGLLKIGIREINGKVVFSMRTSDIQPLPEQWPWSDLGNYFGTSCLSLNWNENMYKLYFKSGLKIGDTCKIIRTEPELKNFNIRSFVTTAAEGSGDNAYIFSAPGSNQAFITGTIPLNQSAFEIKGAIQNPLDVFYRQFVGTLNKSNIKFKGDYAVSYNLKNDFKKVAKIESVSLKEIIRYTNVHSINIAAEALLRRTFSSTNTYKQALEAMLSFWNSKSVSTKGMIIQDACGLAVPNNFTSKFITDILYEMSKDSNFVLYYNSIPVCGVEGTVRNFGKNSKVQNNARLKSGTLNKVCAYSGYLKTAKGKELIVSVIANNYTCSTGEVKKIIEKLLNYFHEN